MLIQRQKQLLHILSEDDKWFTLSEISKELSCSIKTVRKDILIIKDFLPLNWAIEVKKGKGLKMLKPTCAATTELDSLFFKNNIIFKVLNKFLEENTHTVSSLAASLYIQESTIYPILKKIDNYLKDFKLSLKRRPLHIEGDELQIIFMFYDLYINAFNEDEWPFPEQSSKSLTSYLEHISETLGITFLNSSTKRLSFFIAILITRKRKENVANLEEGLFNNIVETPFYQKIANIDEKHYNLCFTVKEKAIITVAINCSKYIYKDLEHVKNEVIQCFIGGNISVLNYVKEFIHILEKKFGKRLSENEEFVFSIIEYFKHTAYKLKVLSKIQLPEKETTKYVKRNHSQTFNKVREAYNEWINKYNISNSVSEEEITTVTTHVEATFMLSKPKSKKVLLIIDEGISWSRYIKGILNVHFGNILQFVDHYEKKTRGEFIKQQRIDLIITTIAIPCSSVPVIHISVIPNNRELNDIKNFLDFEHG
ncbi:helix-turn-helix domain-containing protein [Bacillus toyonensis]|uniref:BglG family transcription antiterminator n=1 Tax=Bacillus toyonensis TaxID=155322 RepID=UPI003D1F5D11